MVYYPKLSRFISVERGEAHDNMEKILSEIIYSENQTFQAYLCNCYTVLLMEH